MTINATMTPYGADGYVDFRPALWALTNVRAGDSKAILVQVNTGGVPADLTGMTIVASARQTAVDPDPPALTALISPDDLTQGRFFLRWDPDEIREVLGSHGSWTGVWDCQIDVTTIVAGPITLESDVTRNTVPQVDPANHGLLIGLGDNDHPQYQLAGRLIWMSDLDETDTFAMVIQPRPGTYGTWYLNPVGYMAWGPGDGPSDLNLYRAAPGVLRTEHSFQTANGIAVAGPSDVGARWLVTATGEMYWGPGDGPVDLILGRASPGVLTTSHSFWIGTNLTVGGALAHQGTTAGFYGAAPVAKAANPGTATGTDAAVINAVITALRNLGLVT